MNQPRVKQPYEILARTSEGDTITQTKRVIKLQNKRYGLYHELVINVGCDA